MEGHRHAPSIAQPAGGCDRFVGLLGGRHAGHGVAVGSTRWIETTEFSDGAGSIFMTKATAAPDGATARWIGSGRVVLNNKGLPIKQYEPFYSTTDAFEAEEGFSGVTPLITYDPLGRAIRVDLPNGTLRRIEFSPWEQTTWDENDTVTESEWYDERIGQSPAHEEEDLALDAAEHADTPTTVRLDVLGRPFQTIERLDESTELLTTLTLDAVGNPLVVTDPREVEIQTQSFDMLGRPITTESPDGGDVTALLDVAGQPLFLWKPGNLGIETEVDALRRKVRTWQWDTDAETKVLRERIVYGEALDDSGTYDPKDDHLRGRLYRIYDTAGMVELSYDFKGNVLTTTRRFFDDDEEDINWQSFDPVAYPFVGDDKDSVAELHNGDGGSNPGAASLLESEEFTVSATFDAMNRVVTRTTPDGAVTAHEYDDGGRLNLVEVDSDTIVADIQHNARGQRTFISYGNGVTTTSAYEPLTFRLHTLVSSGGRQSLEYRYDPVGNILGIDNNADDTLYFDNAAVEPHQSFQYDALYRLTNAWGREKSARGRADWVEPAFGPVPDTSETMQGYEQRYSYDVAGNITEMRHLLGSTTDWVRTYTYPTTSNRLSTTTEAAGIVSYQHDVRGNIVFWPHLYNGSGSPPNVEVDFRDQMRKAQLDSSNYAVYHYDHSGQRARKVVKRGANVEERRYVAGWEVWRKVVSGTLDEERTTLHVMDDERRVAMSETKTVAGGSAVGTTVPRVRYQLDNHLGTSVLELDESGGVISYEEYHPYGTCAWWAGDAEVVSQRRYRYTGMERDEETGLQVHGVRYYAAWLGRWGSADPIGLGDGGNRFGYVRGNPVNLQDTTGMASEDGADPDNAATRQEKGAIEPTTTSTIDPSSEKALGVGGPLVKGVLAYLFDPSAKPSRAERVGIPDAYHLHLTIPEVIPPEGQAALDELRVASAAMRAADDGAVEHLQKTYETEGKAAAEQLLRQMLDDGELGRAMTAYMESLSTIKDAGLTAHTFDLEPPADAPNLSVNSVRRHYFFQFGRKGATPWPTDKKNPALVEGSRMFPNTAYETTRELHYWTSEKGTILVSPAKSAGVFIEPMRERWTVETPL